MLVEEQNRRISELEEAVRTGRELKANPDTVTELNPPPVSDEGTGPEEAHERGFWRRVADWFGFGRAQP
jgi:hypothetical protein